MGTPEFVVGWAAVGEDWAPHLQPASEVLPCGVRANSGGLVSELN